LLAGWKAHLRPLCRPVHPALTGRRIVGILLGLCLIMKQDGFDSEAGKSSAGLAS
jgi:hypothetical protein